MCACAPMPRSLPHSNVGTYATVWGNFVICPPPGGRLPIFAYNSNVDAGGPDDNSYDVKPGNCTDQIKSTIFTDPRPASCEPPAPTWPCSAAACWIDTSNRTAVLAAYRAYHGGTTFGASHADYSYGARTSAQLAAEHGAQGRATQCTPNGCVAGPALCSRSLL
jgi:hypothetical protein